MAWNLRFNDGTNWSGWQSIDAPQNEITVSHNTTRMVHQLYTGARGRTIPSTKYNYETTELEWNFISGGSALLSNGASGGSGLSLYSIISGGFKTEFSTHALSGTSTSQVWQCYLNEVPKVYRLGMFKSDGSAFSEFYDVSTTIDLLSVT